MATFCKNQLLSAIGDCSLIMLVLFFATSVFLHSQTPTRFDYQVRCANPYDCSPSVGAVLNTKGMCTGFLLAPDIVGTNRHCLPEELRLAGASCKEKLEIVFPSSRDFKEERIWCQQVLEVSDPVASKLNPDFAFLKLARAAKRPALQVSQKGVKEGEPLKIWLIKFFDKEGELSTTSCKTVLGSLINVYSQTGTSPMISLKDCPIVQGNSGSPIVDGENKVRGLISVYQEAKGSARFGGGFNFACLHSPSLGILGQPPKTCQMEFSGKQEEGVKNRSLEDLNKKLNAEMEQRMNRALKKFSPQTREFMYAMDRKCQEVGERGFQRCVFELLPKCIHRPLVEQKSSGIHRYSEKLPRWTVGMFLDADLKPKSELKEELMSYRLRYSKTDFSHKMLELELSPTVGEPRRLKLFPCP